MSAVEWDKRVLPPLTPPLQVGEPRKKPRKWDEAGSVTVWFVMTLPILLVFFCLFLNAIIMIDARMRMHGAIERGVYAGAAHLSYVMNEVARLNKQFYDEYEVKERELNPPSIQNSNWTEEQVKQLNDNQTKLYNQMASLLASGYKSAHAIARDVTERNLANTPHLIEERGYEWLYGDPGEPMFDMVNDRPAGGSYLNHVLVWPANIEGAVFDPSNYDPQSYDVYKYLVKRMNMEDYTAIGSGIVVNFVPPVWRRFFSGSGEGFLMHAVAAAQPSGGSIKEYALSDGDERYLYHPVFVPLSVTAEGASDDVQERIEGFRGR